MQLQQQLAGRVHRWRASGYAHDDYPIVAEILTWAADPGEQAFRLRPPQILALESYWFLRLIENTPHILELYRRCFAHEDDLAAALGLPASAWGEAGGRLDALQTRVQVDDAFVRRHKLQALRETLSLEYASYILALAMGTGKTVIIGSIVASEFALALAYPGGPFVQNALVFAPGRTVIESLRELVEMEYASVLPPHLHDQFAALCKFTFTQDGERDLPVLRGSAFNVIVTNTEKIRIQKEKVRATQLGARLTADQATVARAEIANLRLQTIASLPHLAVFSDEAHHTYGQALGAELKKVRKTVDYLAASTNLVCVVNTTGTPYFKRQPLLDVVVWYGLAEGIRDGILKEVAGNILAYDLHNNSTSTHTKTQEESSQLLHKNTDILHNTGRHVAHVVKDFFDDYRDVALPDGTPAKLAIYFPLTEDVQRWRPAIESALVAMGLSTTLILEHHTRLENKADFDRFRFKESPHRIALLVDRGVEGWDVPALFGCVLARTLKDSNNFVLQAACRCLRQVPGNDAPARIYLTAENRAILDHQLQETFGETLADLNRTRRIHSKPPAARPSQPSMAQPAPATGPRAQYAIVGRLTRPEGTPPPSLLRQRLSIDDHSGLVALDESRQIDLDLRLLDLYAAAVELAATYRLPLWSIYDELRRIYAGERVAPAHHLTLLRGQIEQTRC